jgi:rubrerythrin
MVTMVGTEADFLNLLGDLASLDYDAIAAYDSAISRIDNPQFKRQLEQFREDHQRHTIELGTIISQLGGAPPSGAGAKSMLTQGKVVLGGLMGDKAILVAMKTNEDDTNTAYERAVNHEGRHASAEEVLRRGLADERRHRAWIEEMLPTL